MREVRHVRHHYEREYLNSKGVRIYRHEMGGQTNIALRQTQLLNP
jgi:hypothetical protein